MKMEILPTPLATPDRFVSAMSLSDDPEKRQLVRIVEELDNILVAHNEGTPAEAWLDTLATLDWHI